MAITNDRRADLEELMCRLGIESKRESYTFNLMFSAEKKNVYDRAVDAKTRFMKTEAEKDKFRAEQEAKWVEMHALVSGVNAARSAGIFCDDVTKRNVGIDARSARVIVPDAVNNFENLFFLVQSKRSREIVAWLKKEGDVFRGGLPWNANVQLYATHDAWVVLNNAFRRVFLKSCETLRLVKDRTRVNEVQLRDDMNTWDAQTVKSVFKTMRMWCVRMEQFMSILGNVMSSAHAFQKPPPLQKLGGGAKLEEGTFDTIRSVIYGTSERFACAAFVRAAVKFTAVLRKDKLLQEDSVYVRMQRPPRIRVAYPYNSAPVVSSSKQDEVNTGTFAMQLADEADDKWIPGLFREHVISGEMKPASPFVCLVLALPGKAIRDIRAWKTMWFAFLEQVKPMSRLHQKPASKWNAAANVPRLLRRLITIAFLESTHPFDVARRNEHFQFRKSYLHTSDAEEDDQEAKVIHIRHKPVVMYEVGDLDELLQAEVEEAKKKYMARIDAYEDAKDMGDEALAALTKTLGGPPIHRSGLTVKQMRRLSSKEPGVLNNRLKARFVTWVAMTEQEQEEDLRSRIGDNTDTSKEEFINNALKNMEERRSAHPSGVSREVYKKVKAGTWPHEDVVQSVQVFENMTFDAQIEDIAFHDLLHDSGLPLANVLLYKNGTSGALDAEQIAHLEKWGAATSEGRAKIWASMVQKEAERAAARFDKEQQAAQEKQQQMLAEYAEISKTQDADKYLTEDELQVARVKEQIKEYRAVALKLLVKSKAWEKKLNEVIKKLNRLNREAEVTLAKTSGKNKVTSDRAIAVVDKAKREMETVLEDRRKLDDEADDHQILVEELVHEYGLSVDNFRQFEESLESITETIGEAKDIVGQEQNEEWVSQMPELTAQLDALVDSIRNKYKVQEMGHKVISKLHEFERMRQLLSDACDQAHRVRDDLIASIPALESAVEDGDAADKATRKRLKAEFHRLRGVYGNGGLLSSFHNTMRTLKFNLEDTKKSRASLRSFLTRNDLDMQVVVDEMGGEKPKIMFDAFTDWVRDQMGQLDVTQANPTEAAREYIRRVDAAYKVWVRKVTDFKKGK